MAWELTALSYDKSGNKWASGFNVWKETFQGKWVFCYRNNSTAIIFGFIILDKKFWLWIICKIYLIFSYIHFINVYIKRYNFMRETKLLQTPSGVWQEVIRTSLGKKQIHSRFESKVKYATVLWVLI